MLLISLYDPDTHLDTAISKMLAEKWQDMDRIIDQFLLLPRVMYSYLKIVILLQGRLAIDHRILKIHFLVNRCGVIIPFTNQGIIVKGSYYLLYVRCRLLNGLLLRLLHSDLLHGDSHRTSRSTNRIRRCRRRWRRNRARHVRTHNLWSTGRCRN